MSYTEQKNFWQLLAYHTAPTLLGIKCARIWVERVKADGAVIVNGEGIIVNETPDDTALEQCKTLGRKLAE